MNTEKPKGTRLRVLPVICLVLFLFYLGFMSHTEPTQIGIARNRITGNMWLQDHAGWKFSWPWVSVVRIDTRPVRVGVPSAGRGYNYRLVQFVPTEWRKFVDTEGFRYYWWANRFSINFGHHDEYRGMNNILRGYAYSKHHYSFVRVLEDYEGK
jgi:hypothetical protein